MKKIILIVAILSSLQARAQESTNIARKEYLAVLTLTERYKDDKNWGKPEKDIIGEHFQRLGYMKQEGIVVMAGRTQLESNDPYMMGLVIFYAKDDKHIYFGDKIFQNVDFDSFKALNIFYAKDKDSVYIYN